MKPSEIDILVINCSLFSPTPSLCSMVINKFGLRSDVSSYNLSGMGCSAGVISVDLAKNLMASRPNSVALIVSTENLTQNLYLGNEKAFLLQNTLFRVGGAAIILSNRWLDAYKSNFKLLVAVRTQAVDEKSFGCVYETEDAKQNRGVRLSKDIVKVAGKAMEKNFTTLGPYVLTFSEQFKTIFWMAVREYYKRMGWQKITPYVPDFKRGIDHFCIHAGGRAVIDGIAANLKLNDDHVEPSRHTLYTYGNTSSSSIWYEMDYIRKNMKLKTGQRVLQVAFGSGFKCNSAVWLCINNYSANRSNDNDFKDKID
jgi:3-ketoacyl-CoA synthase